MQKKEQKTIAKEDINYKNVELLKTFLNKRFRIKNREETGLTGKNHRLATIEIKKARIMGLLPFSDSHSLI